VFFKITKVDIILCNIRRNICKLSVGSSVGLLRISQNNVESPTVMAPIIVGV
jgi:hypothetical protein